MSNNYRHLAYEERCHIDELNKSGRSQGEIATQLGRSRSTINREVRRYTGGRGYRQKQAQDKAAPRSLDSPSVRVRLG